MPIHQTRTRPQRRRDLEIAKRQFTFLVSITAAIFILCPEFLRTYRNLCIVLALAWVTGFAFDLINSLSNSWDNVPTVLKYSIPFDMNIPITAPFDQISTYVGPILSCASSHARFMALEAKARIVALRQVVLLVLVNWILRRPGLGENSDGKFEDGAPGPAPISDRWYGLLVMTPPVHDYGSLPIGLNTSERFQPIPWDSHEILFALSIFPPSDFQVHLSFCLVPKTVWESQDTTLAEKLKAGLYWDMRGENCGSDGEVWAQSRVQRITGIEILGLVDEDQDCVNSCHAYFAALRQDWNYLKISWNDVDFAIILGFLATRPQATQSAKDLLIWFTRLRIHQALGVREQVPIKGFLASWCVCAVSGVVTSVAGGLTAPITVPLFIGSCALCFGLAVAGITMTLRDTVMWDRRAACCQDLQRRFPQLEGFLEE